MSRQHTTPEEQVSLCSSLCACLVKYIPHYFLRYGSGYSLQAKLGQKMPTPTTYPTDQEETVFSVANPATEDGNPDHQSTLKRLMHAVHTMNGIVIRNDVDTVVLIHLQGDLFICLLAVSLHKGSMASEIIMAAYRQYNFTSSYKNWFFWEAKEQIRSSIN